MVTAPSPSSAARGEPALQPVPVQAPPPPSYAASTRRWQGIASLERSPGGRLWAMWYSGGNGEGPQNYVTVAASDDHGVTWREPLLVIDPPGQVRAYDPCPWVDPTGRLWLCWAQSEEWFDGRCGVWAVTAERPDELCVQWSAPRRLADGIMMCKPTVLYDGRWLMPAAVWNLDDHPRRPDMDAYRFSNVYQSVDQGATWTLLGSAEVPQRVFDEHMVVERRDGSLWMLVRTSYGIGESFSYDGGRTWTPGRPSAIASPGSRFFIRRLQSGALLLVNHYQFTQRSHLTASLSDDDGQTWPHHLLLDERANVSYPDGVQGPDGMIHIVYDRERKGAGEILLAQFTEADVRAGQLVTPQARLRGLISKLR